MADLLDTLSLDQRRARYMERADDVLRRATRTKDPNICADLLKVAASWLLLAHELEKECERANSK